LPFVAAVHPATIDQNGNKRLKVSLTKTLYTVGDHIMIRVKRVYETAEMSDGFRILVDRLWPRGLTKERARIDLWLKDVAPSNELRKWFSHDPERWAEFKSRYFEELDNDKTELLKLILKKTEEGVVTLLYAAKNEDNNNAVALKDYIEKVTIRHKH